MSPSMWSRIEHVRMKEGVHAVWLLDLTMADKRRHQRYHDTIHLNLIFIKDFTSLLNGLFVLWDLCSTERQNHADAELGHKFNKAWYGSSEFNEFWSGSSDPIQRGGTQITTWYLLRMNRDSEALSFQSRQNRSCSFQFFIFVNMCWATTSRKQ